MFPSIVSRAQTLEMLSNGVAESYDGAIQLGRRQISFVANTIVISEEHYLMLVLLRKKPSDLKWIVLHY